jgi:hypothetical protein
MALGGGHQVKKNGTQHLSLAIMCVVGVMVALQNTRGLAGTEFSGGWLTGPLLSMTDVGAVLFLLALGVTFAYSRVAAAIGLASALLCLPLYLFLTAPGPFSKIFGFGHELKVPPSAGLRWDTWAIMGVLTLAATAYVCIRGVAAPGREHVPERG